MHRSVGARAKLLVSIGVLALGVAGCAPTLPTTGTVTAALQTPSGSEASDPVDIVVSVDGAEVASFRLNEGEGQSVGEIPFGWVTIDAVGLCSGEAELLATSPTMSLTIGDTCAVGD
ncbi:hypothetical protein [Leucobacter komagatae]|uniref:hypothetical protein n=1 Tax=Leucobacter komagatae TaxID=55969 RepID=UPI0012EE89D1|nr:hypothetical protein [Leucobacter komagatae]